MCRGPGPRHPGGCVGARAPGEALGLFLVTRTRRPPLTIARARAELTAREDDLKEAKTALDDLLAEAEAEVQAEKRREETERQIAALKKEQADAQTRIDALQRELDKDR